MVPQTKAMRQKEVEGATELCALLRRSLAPLADDCPRAVSDQTRAALQYVAMSQDLTHARHNDNLLDRLIAAAEGLTLTAVRS
jgi:hypothetical protein